LSSVTNQQKGADGTRVRCATRSRRGFAPPSAPAALLPAPSSTWECVRILRSAHLGSDDGPTRAPLLVQLTSVSPANGRLVQFLALTASNMTAAARDVRAAIPGCATLNLLPDPNGAGIVSETSIAAGKDSSTSPKEEPMYKWVSHKPYKHHQKWRVWFRGADGRRCHHTFDTEEAAVAFIQKERAKLLPTGGHAIGDLLSQYLESRRLNLRPSSIKTLGFRIRTIIQGRDAVAVEIFPWIRAWSEHAAKQSVDSQHGILAANRGLIGWCVTAGFLRRDPLAEIQVNGHKKRGKKQLHIDESRRFVAEALKHPNDPLAVACAAMIYTGLRPGEIMGLQVRDLDADGTILWVEESKTEAGKRGVEVAEVFRPFLESLARGRKSQDYLFDFQPERSRTCRDERKRRTDALLRRTRSLCQSADLPVVCSHSMRGLHSTLAAGFGATGHAVAKALGHTSFNVTKRHYVNRDVLENASLRKSLQVLQGSPSGSQGGNWSSESVTADLRNA
jgi:integrase